MIASVVTAAVCAIWSGAPLDRLLPSGATVLTADKLLIGCGDVNTTGVRAGGNFAGKIDEVRISSVARYTGLTTPETTTNGPDGELVGGVDLTDSGKYGPGLSFDGSGYVKLTDDGDFLKLSAAERTIELWVKADSTSGTQMLYEEGNSTNGFALRLSSGNLEFIARTSSGTPETLSATYTSTDWHKVTAVYDDGAMTLYIDGTSVDSATANFSSVAAHSDGAALGGTLGSDAFGGSTTGGSFDGCLDAVRVFSAVAAPGSPAAVETTYTYNERSQLTLEEVTGGTDKHYYYNPNGENTGKDPDPESEDHNIAIEEYSGETLVSTTRMEYDVFGRMTKWSKTDGSGTVTEEHTYRGAEWHRATTAVGATTTRYLYDGDNVVGDLNTSNAFTRQYVTPFLDENLSMTIVGTGTYYYNRDGLGSVRNLTDASQDISSTLAYTAFGSAYTPAVSNPDFQRYTFTGREAPSANGGAPMFYRNRMYSPALGRFGRRDPVNDDRNSFSPYSGMANNPISVADPRGTELTVQAQAQAEMIREMIAELLKRYGRNYTVTLKQIPNPLRLDKTPPLIAGADKSYRVVVAAPQQMVDAALKGFDMQHFLNEPFDVLQREPEQRWLAAATHPTRQFHQPMPPLSLMMFKQSCCTKWQPAYEAMKYDNEYRYAYEFVRGSWVYEKEFLSWIGPDAAEQIRVSMEKEFVAMAQSGEDPTRLVSQLTDMAQVAAASYIQDSTMVVLAAAAERKLMADAASYARAAEAAARAAAMIKDWAPEAAARLNWLASGHRATAAATARVAGWAPAKASFFKTRLSGPATIGTIVWMGGRRILGGHLTLAALTEAKTESCLESYPAVRDPKEQQWCCPKGGDLIDDISQKRIPLENGWYRYLPTDHATLGRVCPARAPEPGSTPTK